MRNSVKTPQNRITQGTIFFGVKPPYDECSPCFGISITARCDTARDFKAPSLTFLPVVQMEEWLWYEALPRCIEEQKKSAVASIRSHLLRKTGTCVVLEAFGIQAAFEAADQTDKGVIKHRAQYTEAESAQLVARFEWNKLPQSIITRVKADAAQLLTGKNQNFFFIDAVEADYGQKSEDPKCGFVAVLRDIRTVSRDLALKIVEGIDYPHLIELRKIDPTAYQLSISDSDFIYPTGEFTPPFIEQLMQNFSMLFGRIGTKDIPSSYSIAIDQILGVKN